MYYIDFCYYFYIGDTWDRTVNRFFLKGPLLLILRRVDCGSIMTTSRLKAVVQQTLGTALILNMAYLYDGRSLQLLCNESSIVTDL